MVERQEQTLGGTARDRQAIAEQSPGGLATWARDAGQAEKLWDVIDQAWTKPLPSYMVRRHLQKVVYSCAVCTYTSGFPKYVTTHIRHILEQGETHQQAKAFDIRIGDTMVFQCSACEVKSSREMDIRRHVTLVSHLSTRHKNGATEKLIKRFTLEPSGSAEHLIMPTPDNTHIEEFPSSPQPSNEAKDTIAALKQTILDLQSRIEALEDSDNYREAI